MEQLADGRIVIHILGERLAFREQDASRVGLNWPPYPCDPKPMGSTNLELWLQDPRVASCLDRYIPDAFVSGERQSVVLRIHLAYEDGSRYPGAGKRIDQPLGDMPPLYPGGVSVKDLPSPPLLSGEVFLRVRDPYTPLWCLSPAEGSPDELGFQVLRAGRSPTGGLYTVPPNRRIGETSRPLCVTCSQLSGCTVVLRSSDSAVSLELNWHERDIHRPQANWLLYDAAARDIANSIFIDRSLGDVQ